MTSLPRIGVHWLYVKEPELENETLSKVMNRWVSFRLKVVSQITNNDNSTINGLFINEKLLSKLF